MIIDKGIQQRPPAPYIVETTAACFRSSECPVRGDDVAGDKTAAVIDPATVDRAHPLGRIVLDCIAGDRAGALAEDA